ncbi:hypothetical protein CsSME_00021340 [Camellia sinensis var. sinensis]
MKPFLLILVVFMSILATLQANTERLTLVDYQLLSDANRSRKVNIGANNKGSNEKSKSTSIDAESEHNDDYKVEIQHVPTPEGHHSCVCCSNEKNCININT